MEKTSKIIAAAIALAISPVVFWLIIWYNAFSYGYVAIQFHEWFIAPILPQVPVFSIYEYAGLILFIGIFTRRRGESFPKIKNEYLEEKEYQRLVRSLVPYVRPWGLLLCGYILQYWIKP